MVGRKLAGSTVNSHYAANDERAWLRRVPTSELIGSGSFRIFIIPILLVGIVWRIGCPRSLWVRWPLSWCIVCRGWLKWVRRRVLELWRPDRWVGLPDRGWGPNWHGIRKGVWSD